MKKYPKIVQCDARGQIVIPKDIRSELRVDEGSGFYIYSIDEEGILLKKIPDSELDKDDTLISEIRSKSKKLDIDPKNIDKTLKKYKKKKSGKLDVL